MERYSTGYGIKEMQTKTTLKDYRMPIRMAQIQDSDTIKCWCRCGAIGTLIRCWWKCETVQPLWKTAWQFLIKLKLLLPYDLVVTLLSIYSDELKTYSHTKPCPLAVYSSCIHNCQNLVTKLSFGRRIDT